MIQTKYFPFVGGLNTTSPPLSINPGEMVDCLNYECLQGGGYQLVRGYKRFDGRTDESSVIPGEGPVRGVHVYRGSVYAVRDDAEHGRLYRATEAGWVEVDSAFTFSKAGDYQFTNYNFYGQDDQEEMFIVNGLDKAVKFDGDGLIQIHTGLTDDRPSHVMGYKKHLILGVQSSLIGSGIGDPEEWDASTGGAFEIALGDTVTNLEVSQGALVIGCRSSTHVLYGDSAADFKVDPLNKTGTFPNTMQNIGGQLIGLDNAGVMNLQASNAYGNFLYASISEKVRNLVQDLIKKGRCVSVLNRGRGQYRLFSGDNGLYFSMSGPNLLGITKVKFPKPVLCAVNGSGSDGSEVSYFGSDDGAVYRMDDGNKFYQDSIPSMMQLAFHSFGLPTQRNRYRQISLDLRMEGEVSALYIQPYTDYGAGAGGGQEVSGQMNTGSRWDVGSWDAFFWDGTDTQTAKARINAAGRNFGAYITSENTGDCSHAIYGATIHYSPRRLVR